jgi:hypothetical protein
MVKKHLNNIILCYHGCVNKRVEALTFREHINDFKAHINHLKDAGYTFVKPSDYAKWQAGTWMPGYPIVCVHLDDGLESVKLILPWLAENSVPYGLAVIGRRQRLHLPEQDFASWAELSSYVAAGFCELMNHTYNMHHLTVGDSTGETRPIMEGPPWVDNGEVLYRASGDARVYWDYAFLDGSTWGFPLFGTDPAGYTLDKAGNIINSGSSTITSSFTFKAGATQIINVLRFWAVLHVPFGAGYDCEIRIKNGANQLFQGIFKPKDYETRSQWQEREHVTINLDTGLAVVAGSTYTIDIITLTAGIGLFRCAALPDFSGDYSLTSDTVSAIPGENNKEGMIDYPAGASWPARLAVILGDGSGAAYDSSAYFAYIEADLQTNQDLIRDYLDAAWTYHKHADEFAEFLFQEVIFGTYSDGTKVDSKFLFTSSAAHTAYTLRWKYTEYVGEWYPIVANVYVGLSSTGPWTEIAHHIAPNFNNYHWQEIVLDTPYAFGVGDYWLRFETLNATPFAAPTVLRIYSEGSKVPQLRWSSESNTTGTRLYGAWIPDPGIERAGEKILQPQDRLPTFLDIIGVDAISKKRAVFLQPEFSDVWPTQVKIVWTQNTEDTYGFGSDWFYVYNENSDSSKAIIETASRVLGSAAQPDRMIYPFGAFYSEGTGSTEIKKIDDVSPELKTAMSNAGLNDGRSIWPNPNRVDGALAEPGARHTEWTQGSLLIYGDISPGLGLNNIQAYTGTLWDDAVHGGVQWQTSIEPDLGGNATVRNNYPALDFMAFDAWFFNAAGGIFKDQLQDGGTYIALDNFTPGFAAGDTITGSISNATATITWSNENTNNPILRIVPVSGTLQAGDTVTTTPPTGQGDIDNFGLQVYPDDKTFLQDRGIKCLLIISNFSHALGDIDPALASTVVNNPVNYLNDVIDAIVDNGWDGVTINLEAVPKADREAASSFIISVAEAMHTRHLLCHMTSPAKTGTSYDTDWWTDWCDHGRLVRYVDAIKIMSYTEAGDWSPPQPHAPTWFWDAVYDFTDKVIPLDFKRRVLVGCNSHSDVWGNGPDTYTNFHEALATGLLRGAEFIKGEGEGYWSKRGVTAWMGIPETLTRASNEAVKRGYGGIGSWKADDGDIHKHYPANVQLGRYDDNVDFPVALPEFLYGLIGFASEQVFLDETHYDHHKKKITYLYSRLHLEFKEAVISDLQKDELISFTRTLSANKGKFRFASILDSKYSVDAAADGEQRTFTPGLPIRSIVVKIDGIAAVPDSADYDKGLISFYTAPTSGAVVNMSGVRYHIGHFLSYPKYTSISDGVYRLSNIRIMES